MYISATYIMLMTLTAEMTNEERKQKRREMAYPQIIAICKANGIEPREWFKDVIRRIPEYENGRSDVTHLLPKNWKRNSNDCNQCK